MTPRPAWLSVASNGALCPTSRAKGSTKQDRDEGARRTRGARASHAHGQRDAGPRKGLDQRCGRATVHRNAGISGTSGTLYDKLHVSHDGYAGAVPIVHKSAAVSEVIAQLANRNRRRPGIAAPDSPEGPGVRFLIRSALRQGTLCGARKIVRAAYSVAGSAVIPGRRRGITALLAGPGGRPSISATAHACSKHLVEDAFDTPNGILVRRCFRLLNAKAMGLTITLADITEEGVARHGVDRGRAPGTNGSRGQGRSKLSLPLRKLSRR